jgi:hypothetical protein
MQHRRCSNRSLPTPSTPTPTKPPPLHLPLPYTFPTLRRRITELCWSRVSILTPPRFGFPRNFRDFWEVSKISRDFYEISARFRWITGSRSQSLNTILDISHHHVWDTSLFVLSISAKKSWSFLFSVYIVVQVKMIWFSFGAGKTNNSLSMSVITSFNVAIGL